MNFIHKKMVLVVQKTPSANMDEYVRKSIERSFVDFERIGEEEFSFFDGERHFKRVLTSCEITELATKNTLVKTGYCEGLEVDFLNCPVPPRNEFPENWQLAEDDFIQETRFTIVDCAYNTESDKYFVPSKFVE